MAEFKSGDMTFIGNGRAVYERDLSTWTGHFSNGTLNFNTQTTQNGLINISLERHQTDGSIRAQYYALNLQKSYSKLYLIYQEAQTRREYQGLNGMNLDLEKGDYFVIENNKITKVRRGNKLEYNIITGELIDLENGQTGATTPSGTTQDQTGVAQQPSGTTTTPPPPSQVKYTIRPYDKMKEIQQWLKMEGLYNDAIDGKCGPNTVLALYKYFQKHMPSSAPRPNTQLQTNPGPKAEVPLHNTGSATTNSTQLQEVKSFYDLLDRMKDVF